MAEPISTFYGIEIPAGKSVLVTPRVDEEMTGYEIINLTQVALGAKPAKGAHTLFIQSIGNTDDSDSEAEEKEEEDDVEVEGPKIAVATLDAVHHPHVSVDFSVSLAPILVSHTGSSSLFLSGYAHRQEFPADEDDFDQSDSEEDAPNGVPLGSSDDDEAYDSDESMEEDEEEEEEPEPSPEPVKAPAPKRKAAAEPTPAKKVKAEPAPAAKKAAPAAKKAEPAKKADASGDDAAKEYVEALKSAVKAKGTVRLAELGSAVKRPAAAPKLKTAIEKNKTIFSYDEKTGTVSLA